VYSSAFSQSNTTALSKLYLQTEIGAASRKGDAGEIGLRGVIKNNWVAGVSYHSINMDPKNKPEDYDPGYAIIFFIPIDGTTPSVDMKLVSFTLGKYHKAGRDTWFTTEAGLSYVQGKTTEFSRNSSTGGSWFFIVGDSPSNYNYTQEKKSTVGALLKADFNWAFSSYVGLGASLFTSINSIQSPVGFQVKMIFGKMNRDKKRKKAD
jgi:hypothetical protein